MLLEADICGGGPSGRNGGFATGWWDELPTLIERHGQERAVAAAQAIDDAVDEIGRWCDANGVDAWYTKRGTLSVSAAPAQDDKWQEAVAACRDAGFGDRYVALDAAAVRAHVASPVLRGGAFMPVAATIQPAFLARGLRRAALERGVVIHEGTRVVELDGERPGWLGSLGAGGRRAPAARTGRPVRIRTTSGAGAGEVIAGAVVVGMNAWAAAWPSFGRRLVTWSSYIVLTEPIPDRLEEIGWTGGEGLADARFTLHYLRTTRDGRIAIGGGGGRAGFGGRIGPVFTDDATATSRAAAGLRRLFPSLRGVRIEDAWGGPIDISADHLPSIGTVPGRPIHFAHGYSGNGVAPSVVAGRALAGLALGTAPVGLAPVGRRGARGRPRTGVPAGAVPVPRRERDPRGDRPPRGHRGARRDGEPGAPRAHAAAPAARLPPFAGLTAAAARGSLPPRSGRPRSGRKSSRWGRL